MSKVQGIIEKAYKNDKGINSICIGDVWYGTYKQDCKQFEGQQVEFDKTERTGNNGKTYFNANNVVPVAQTATASGPAPAAGVLTPDARQKTITLQSSYKTAAQVLAGLIASDKVVLGAKNAAFDNALGLLDQITLHIYANCIDPDRLLVTEEDAPGPAGEYVAHEA